MHTFVYSGLIGGVEATAFVDELGRSAGLERPAPDGARYLSEACAILKVEPEALASNRRDRETAALRKLVAAVGIERCGQRAGDLARLLDKHTVAVSRWVSDAARERQTSPAYEKKLLRLHEQLSERALAAQARGELAQVTLDEQRQETSLLTSFLLAPMPMIISGLITPRTRRAPHPRRSRR